METGRSMSNCGRRERVGCVEKYMENGGSVCWDAHTIHKNCDNWSGVTCDDCGVCFCQLSPMRPCRVMVNGKDYTLCAACQKPYSVHKAHWTYNTYWAIQERKRAEQNHAAMHELRMIYEVNIARMAPNEDSPF